MKNGSAKPDYVSRFSSYRPPSGCFHCVASRESNNVFQHVETLFLKGRNLVPSRPAIGWRKVNKPCQPIASLFGTRFLPWTNEVSTCRKVLQTLLKIFLKILSDLRTALSTFFLIFFPLLTYFKNSFPFLEPVPPFDPDVIVCLFEDIRYTDKNVPTKTTRVL